MGRRTVAPLPVWEQTVYWVCEISTIVYMMYSLFCASEDAWRRNEPLKIEDGWFFLHRPVDTADFEWDVWSSYFWEVLPYMCGHIFVSQVLQMILCDRKKWHVLLTLYGMWGISRLLGTPTVVFFCVQTVIVYAVSMLGSSCAVWATSFAFLTLLNYGHEDKWLWLYSEEIIEPQSSHLWFYLFVFIWANMCQRSTGFALECVWARRLQEKPSSSDLKSSSSSASKTEADKDNKREPYEDGSNKKQDEDHLKKLNCDASIDIPGLVDMLFYMFYFPLFFTGPLLVYNKFHRQAQCPQHLTKQRLKDILLRLLSLLFWAVLNNLWLHYFYAHAINNNSLVLGKQNRWTLASVGYTLGQFFMTKYVVMFGLPAQLARLDGFEPPSVPACISYIYCYTDMWKSFDRGLYDFLKRYIFIPLGGSRVGIARQIQGSILCFVYIFYWHGAEYYLFLWCVINFFEAVFEQIGGYLENTTFVRCYIYDRLSLASVRRIRAIMAIPVFLMSVFAIFYFFGGTYSGEIFLSKMLLYIPWDSFLVFLLLVYCAIQNAMEMERLGLVKLKNTLQKQ